jgi:hypothetical protein
MATRRWRPRHIAGGSRSEPAAAQREPRGADGGAERRASAATSAHTTDVDGFTAAAGDLMPLLGKDGVQPCCTLLGVARLYDPAIMIELEATAVA